MTTNVPQDVIDDTNEAYKRVTGATDLQLATHVYEIANVLCQLRAQRQQGAEPVAWMFRVNHEHTVFSHIEPPSDAYDEGTLVALYTTPPQANALVAAAYRKAAGICDDSHVSWDVHRVNDDTLWNNACTTVKSAILAAVPADAEAALHERDFALCMKAAVEAYIAGQEHGRHGKTADLDAIVNGVLGEGGE